MQPNDGLQNHGLMRRVREFMNKEYREIQRARRDADRSSAQCCLYTSADASADAFAKSADASADGPPRGIHWMRLCQYMNEYDDLPFFDPDDGRTVISLPELWQIVSLQETTAGPPFLPINIEKNIFFHVTSCQQDLTPREACSVEAAARAHPDWDVYVLFSASTQVTDLGSKESVVFSIKLNNIKLSRIYIIKYLEKQPIRECCFVGQRSKYPYTHTLDVLRIATLYRRGGICLDLNVLVTKPLEGGNFAVKRSSSVVSASILALSDDKLGRSIANEAVRRMSESCDWSDLDSGSQFLTRLLETFVCNVSAANMTDELCQGFHVYDLDYANPVPWPMAQAYFTPGDLDDMQSDRTHAHHLWPRQLKCKQPEYGSPFHILARYYCPNIFQKFPEHFGEKVSNTRPS